MYVFYMCFILYICTICITYIYCVCKLGDGLVVKALNSQSRIPCPKPLGCSEVDSALHPSEVDKMSTKNFWKLNGKR